MVLTVTKLVVTVETESLAARPMASAGTDVY